MNADFDGDHFEFLSYTEPMNVDFDGDHFEFLSYTEPMNVDFDGDHFEFSSKGEFEKTLAKGLSNFAKEGSELTLISKSFCEPVPPVNIGQDALRPNHTFRIHDALYILAHNSLNPEDKEDVTVVEREMFHDRVKKCLLCGNESGSLHVITHKYECKYAGTRVCKLIRYRSFNTPVAQADVQSNMLMCGQREMVTASDQFPIIGTMGLGSCIAVAMRAMRARLGLKTVLAHIDILTLNPMETLFDEFKDDEEVEVYICGGDEATINLAMTILESVATKKYKIMYCHLIDEGTINDFGIDSRSGEIYLNLEAIHFNKVSLDEVCSKLLDVSKNICLGPLIKM
jgi:hypothetical protein